MRPNPLLQAMVIFKNIGDIQPYLLKINEKGRPVGFVPTMGALHEGHLSLLKNAAERGDFTVISIFVNPTQFNDRSDYEQYPVSIDNDLLMLEYAGCDAVFIPSVNEMYPEDETKTPVYDFGYLETILEGSYRPGHFKGVGQVVARLLNIVRPQHLYLGQKDYQQCMVIKDLVQQMKMDNRPEVVICPTMREADGLAMSSRNRRLTEPQRNLAGLIYQCLVSIQAKAGQQSYATVQKECTDILTNKGFEPDYVALADADTLELLDDYDINRPMVALVAAKIGDVRLIDNMILQN